MSHTDHVAGADPLSVHKWWKDTVQDADTRIGRRDILFGHEDISFSLESRGVIRFVIFTTFLATLRWYETSSIISFTK